MSSLDDTTPLLAPGPFERGTSLRTSFRRYCVPDDAHSQLQIHGPVRKPPLPPRPPPEYLQRLGVRKSLSVTERGENRASQPICRSYGAPQDLCGKGGAGRLRIPLTPPPVRKTQTTFTKEDVTSPQGEEKSYANESSVSCYQRNGSRFASLPHRKRTPPTTPDLLWTGISTFFRRSASPVAYRKTETQTAEKNINEQDSLNDSNISSSSETLINKLYRKSRRSQTPPPALHSPLPSPVTYRRNNPQNNFTKQGSLILKKSEHPSLQACDTVRRSTSSVQPKRRYATVTLPQPPVAFCQFERPCNNTLTSNAPEVRQGCAWRPKTPLTNRKASHGDWQDAQRVQRQPSLLLQPVTTTSANVVEPQTHGCLALNRPRDSLTTTTTTTTTSSSSPDSHRLPGSLDLDDRGPSLESWDKSYSCSTTEGGVNIEGNGSVSEHGRIKSPSLSLVSSDSGYSSGSSASRSSSVISDGEGDMLEWFGSSMNVYEEKSIETKSNHFTYLMEKEEEYLTCLRSMLNDYQVMCDKTPSLIRQHFDLIFKQVELIYQFQKVLQEDLMQTHGQPEQLARVFNNEQFQCYGRYMVMTPAVQRDLLQFAGHFKENFPDLKRNILKPSLRINFYAMILDSFKREASEEVKIELQAAIDYLNQLKRKANTEMTLTTVVNSPVDLRLGGDMLHIGELTCTGGGPLQKKKYQVILFENLLVITSMKFPYFKYKIHYRVEQLESVVRAGENELLLNVLSEGQTQLLALRFKVKGQKIRDEWISELQKITKWNTKLTHAKSSVHVLQISRQQFRTLPLDLFRVFPLLKAVSTDSAAEPDETESLDGYTLSNMICYEEKYVSNLSSLLNPDIQRPPDVLSNLVEKLHHLHNKLFLPALKRSQKLSDFLDFLVKNLDELSVYTNYLVVRSQLTVKLDEVPQAGPYISPVQQLFGVYFGLMTKLRNFEKHKNAAQRVIERIQHYLWSAQLRVLKEAIVSGRIDFQRSGNLLLYSPMEVKTRKKEVRAGEYIVMLFENVIILTRPKQPYYEYVMDIWLDQVNLGPPASHNCSFRLEVRQGGRKEPITYEMSAANVESKQEWLRRLHQQMLVQVEKIRQRCVHDL